MTSARIALNSLPILFFKDFTKGYTKIVHMDATDRKRRVRLYIVYTYEQLCLKKQWHLAIFLIISCFLKNPVDSKTFASDKSCSFIMFRYFNLSHRVQRIYPFFAIQLDSDPFKIVVTPKRKYCNKIITISRIIVANNILVD